MSYLLTFNELRNLMKGERSAWICVSGIKIILADARSIGMIPLGLFPVLHLPLTE